MNTTHNQQDTPASRNEAWGFWGTMRDHAALAWPLAIAAIAEATGESPQAARAFLDSRDGRHFADEVNSALYAGQSLAEAVQSATGRWMAWTIKRTTCREYGIPHGVPYLTGFVMHAAIHDETVERE
jgi:hypothetical protein